MDFRALGALSLLIRDVPCVLPLLLRWLVDSSGTPSLIADVLNPLLLIRVRF